MIEIMEELQEETSFKMKAKTNKNILFLVLVFGLVVVFGSNASADASYEIDIDWESNLPGYSQRWYECVFTICDMVKHPYVLESSTNTRFDHTELDVDWTIFSKRHSIYVYKQGYVPKNVVLTTWGDYESTFELEWTKKQNAQADILSLNIIGDELKVGEELSVDAIVESAFSISERAEGTSDFIPRDLIEDYYTATTLVEFYIYNLEDEVVASESVILDIPIDQQRTAGYLWTPEQEGDYKIVVLTEVIDDQTDNSDPIIISRDFSVSIEESEEDNSEPEVEILSPTEGEVIEGEYLIEWSASDADQDASSLDVSIWLEGNEIYSSEDNEGSYLWDTEDVADGTGLGLMIIVTDDQDASASDAVTFTIDNEETDGKPNAVIDSPVDGVQVELGREVTFSGHGDDDGSIESCLWSFNHPNSEDVFEVEGCDINYVFEDEGLWKVEFNVKDNAGQWDESPASIFVVVVEIEEQEHDPYVDITNPRMNEQIEGVYDITWGAGDSDQDDSSLDVLIDYKPASAGGSWWDRLLDWIGIERLDEDDWTILFSSEDNPGEFELDTTEIQNGEYVLRVTVEDDTSRIAQDAVIFWITNDQEPSAPFAIIKANERDEMKVYFDASASYDIDGEIVLYEWDFGDGEISHKKRVEHQYSDDIGYVVRLRVVDNDGFESVAEMIVNPSGEESSEEPKDHEFDITELIPKKEKDGVLLLVKVKNRADNTEKVTLRVDSVNAQKTFSKVFRLGENAGKWVSIFLSGVDENDVLKVEACSKDYCDMRYVFAKV